MHAAEQKKEVKVQDDARQTRIMSGGKKWHDETTNPLLNSWLKEEGGGGRTGKAARSGLLSNVSCQFSLCSQLKLLRRSREAVIG